MRAALETGRQCGRRAVGERHPAWAARRVAAFTFIAPRRVSYATLGLARMLDSLVRVSRRVGWGANNIAADPDAPTANDATRGEPNDAATHCEQSVPVARFARAAFAADPWNGGLGR